MIYLQLILSFLKVGLLGFGGGMAIVGLMQAEVERYGWMSATEFTDVVAISQMTPGPIGINCATYTGYTACVGAGFSTPMAILGSVAATCAIVLPSLIIMLILSRIYLHIQGRWSDNKYYQWTMAAIRLLVIGLIAQAAYTLLSPENMRDSFSWIIFAFVMLASERKINPMLVIVLAGVAGWIYYAGLNLA